MSCVKFGELLQRFGPFEVATFDNVVASLKTQYLHGEISAREAKALLSRKGDFLVRLSTSQPDFFVVHLLTNNFVTAVVKFTAAKGFKMENSKDNFFTSLEKLLFHYKKLGFRRPATSRTSSPSLKRQKTNGLTKSDPHFLIYHTLTKK